MSDEQLNTEQNIEAAVIETDPMSKMNCAFCGAEIDIEGLPRFSPVACTACAKENTVSAKLGHFVLLKSLGAGGMGTVFLAEDENLGRKVAIKVMQKQLGQDPALFETFRNEAQSAARLNHPHVAQIYSFGREKGLPYLAMELVNGNKLDEMIESGTALDPAFVLRVGLEIAEGLKAAEEVGLFHGDIKPDNILFDENMQAKLVDFGIASMASQGATNELWGTPYYIAPEKVQKKKNSARSDIYSLGATLYHAIAGQPPYEGADAVAVIKARFAGPPPALESIRPDIEPEVTRIIGRMMYNDLFMRYPNYGSLINDIFISLSLVGKLVFDIILLSFISYIFPPTTPMCGFLSKNSASNSNLFGIEMSSWSTTARYSPVAILINLFRDFVIPILYSFTKNFMRESSYDLTIFSISVFSGLSFNIRNSKSSYVWPRMLSIIARNWIGLVLYNGVSTDIFGCVIVFAFVS